MRNNLLLSDQHQGAKSYYLSCGLALHKKISKQSMCDVWTTDMDTKHRYDKIRQFSPQKKSKIWTQVLYGYGNIYV